MGVRNPNLPWFAVAKELLGTKEIPGSGSNPIIIDWAKHLGGFAKQYYTSDDIPWCGLFVGHCIDEAGIKVTIENPLLAKEWNNFGSGVQWSYYGIYQRWWRSCRILCFRRCRHLSYFGW